MRAFLFAASARFRSLSLHDVAKIVALGGTCDAFVQWGLCLPPRFQVRGERVEQSFTAWGASFHGVGLKLSDEHV